MMFIIVISCIVVISSIVSIVSIIIVVAETTDVIRGPDE